MIWFEDEFIEKLDCLVLVFKEKLRFFVEAGKNLLSGNLGIFWAIVSDLIDCGLLYVVEVSSISSVFRVESLDFFKSLNELYL